MKNDDKIKKCSSQKETNSSKASRSSNHSFEKINSYSGSGATHMFLNLITCGIVDTDDSAMTLIKRKDGTSSMMNASSATQKSIDQVVKRDNIGGSERVSRGHWTTLEKQRDNRKEGSKTTSHNISDPNDKKRIPAAGPYCSQCGRQFNPEKLHTHMKSCRRMKALTKAAKSVSERAMA